MGASLVELLSKLAGVPFFLGTIQQLVPERLRSYLGNFGDKLSLFFYPYIQITFDEYNSLGFRNEAYSCIETYLGDKSSQKAKWLKADKSANSKSLILSLDAGEEIIDEFEGIKLRWQYYKETIKQNSWNACNSVEKNSFALTFHKGKRSIVTEAYLKHVMEEGEAIEYRNSSRKLYANHGYEGTWSCINFDHPARFDTLAMDPKKKQEIIDDLKTFTTGKDYYAKIGKAWKRGYLLYGPPGTDTTSKSLIVIEDIDCSLDLTGKRRNQDEKSVQEEKDHDLMMVNGHVTLSGLLNFIDGLWSASGQERIIIFTTNHVNKLDPALIRRGRMDMHIEMSYCKYEAFKVFAKNYLDIDSHPLFEEIKILLEEVNMSPCDVAENLMPKTDNKEVENCLMNLIEAMKAAKEKASPGEDINAQELTS